MAIKYLHNLDLSQNQLLSAILQNESEAPANPKVGQVYYNTSTNRAYVYTGATTKWVGMDASDAVMSGGDIITEINKETTGTINLARVNVDVYSKDSKGLVPQGVATSAGKFLRDDGGWETPAYASKPSDVALGSVTNNKQVKALAVDSTTDGYIPAWDGKDGDKLKAGFNLLDDLSGAITDTPKQLITAYAVKDYIGTQVGAVDAMRYKGAIDASGNPAWPTSPAVGDTYKISKAGKIGGASGEAVEIGDMIIALVTKTGATTAADWNVIQANIDGAVIGPASASNNRIAVFDNSANKIKDSGKTTSDFAASGHDHNAIYPKVVAASLTADATQLVTHNLGTRDVICKVYQATSPYSEVMVDIEHTSTTQVTVKFAEIPVAGAYRIVIMGIYTAP